MPPPKVEAATEEYRADVDRSGGCLEDCCVVHPLGKVSAATAYQDYRQLCDPNGVNTFSNTVFAI